MISPCLALWWVGGGGREGWRCNVHAPCDYAGLAKLAPMYRELPPRPLTDCCPRSAAQLNGPRGTVAL
eukprot:3280695-Pyramimonas_sp.AAC.4